MRRGFLAKFATVVVTIFALTAGAAAKAQENSPVAVIGIKSWSKAKAGSDEATFVLPPASALLVRLTSGK
jgi:hypothetical protein